MKTYFIRYITLLIFLQPCRVETQPNFSGYQAVYKEKRPTNQSEEQLKRMLKAHINLTIQNKERIKKLIESSIVTVLAATLAILLYSKNTEITRKLLSTMGKYQRFNGASYEAFFKTQPKIYCASGFFGNIAIASFLCAVKNLYELLNLSPKPN